MGPKPKKVPRTSTKSSVTKEPGEQNARPVVPIELQQSILNCFSRTFVSDTEKVKARIQEVKGHLFDRDFVSAFSTEELRAAYIARWSPSRALAYTSIFSSLQALRGDDSSNATPKVLCIGGGAGAEVMAFAATTHLMNYKSIGIVAVDMADWTRCLNHLKTSVQEIPPLSNYAGEAARTANKALLPSKDHDFQLSFIQRDVLDLSESDLRPCFKSTTLTTIMFTLNELFTASMSLTTSFLLRLTDLAEPGSWLLIVDSPGSYSEIRLGKDGQMKQYPMKWLVDYTLLNVAGKDDDGKGSKWMKVDSEDSRWFRLDKKLKYPVDLEDMRYQFHLYRRMEK